MRPWELVTVSGAELEVTDWGSGEPIVFVQTALTADELLPLAEEPVFEDGYRKVVYHRRGYAGSTPTDGPGSIVRDAADCRALIEALEIERAHIVGVSFSGAIGLQLAADRPESTHSLIVIEPPPVHVPSAPEFRAVNDRLLQTRRELGAAAALEEFLHFLIGPDWREAIEARLPGAAAQMERDTATFFDVDMPALLDWRFGPGDADRISCPVLYIGGTGSGPLFAEVRELILRWLPHAEGVIVDGADHSLALTHTSEIADALVAFLRRHMIAREQPPG
jgi:pimeloyl-ACP methyl ester carboxylesterase